MERHYTNEWALEEKVKRREMVTPEARYILVYEASRNHETRLDKWESNLLVGFVNYRFTLEEEIPVLYVYEIQLESCVQGKGLGKFLMQLIELIAQKVLKAFLSFIWFGTIVCFTFYLSNCYLIEFLNFLFCRTA